MFKSKIIAIFMAMIACQSVFANNEQNQQIAEKVAYMYPVGTMLHTVYSVESNELSNEQEITPNREQLIQCFLNNLNDKTYAEFILPKITEFMQTKQNEKKKLYIDALNNTELLDWIRYYTLSHMDAELHPYIDLPSYSTEYYNNKYEKFKSNDQKNITLLLELMYFKEHNVSDLSNKSNIQLLSDKIEHDGQYGREHHARYIMNIVNKCGG